MASLAAAIIAIVTLALSPPALAHDHHPAIDRAGLANATILIVRHAEDADTGPGLSPAGEARARAYARYFRPFMLGQERLNVDTLIAAADSRGSHRSRLTLDPLAHATALSIQQPFHDHDVRDLAAWLGSGAPGRTILIAWHHSDLPRLVHNLGLDPSALLPRGHWSSHTYDWVVVLRFDSTGAIVQQSCRLIREPTPLRA